MDRTEHASPAGFRRRLARGAAGLFAVAVVSGTVFAGCSGSHPSGAADGTGSMATMAPTTAQAMPGATSMTGGSAAGSVAGAAMVDDAVPADAAAAWSSRPAFVRADPRTEAAYSYAMYHPQVIEWMPCYCGCVGTGHRSNLDCYFKPAVPGRPTEFEEHASFCDVCVQTTLLAKQLTEQGKSTREIRQVVDQTFGGNGTPGTDTAQPPA